MAPRIPLARRFVISPAQASSSKSRVPQTEGATIFSLDTWVRVRHHDPQARDANPEWVQGDVSARTYKHIRVVEYIIKMSY